MTRLVQPRLVNDPFGDAGLYLDLRFAKRALLFDLGDLQPLPSRNLLRISHAFVSHAHMDHFSGFDRLLGVCLGRPQPLQLFGPPGFADRVEHKLAAYTWNVIADSPTNFVIGAFEVEDGLLARAAEFHTRDSFRRRDVVPPAIVKGVLLDEPGFQVRTVTLDHGTPSLAFALEEKLRVNVWKDRLLGLGLPVGPWLKDLKDAARRGEPDDTKVTVSWPAAGGRPPLKLPLSELKAQVLHVGPGEKLAYVVDACFHQDNAARIVELARGADQLFIEAVFLAKDAAIAARKRHLTAAQAGMLARKSAVKRVVPFHFSPRYLGREAELREELHAYHAGTA